MGSLFLLVVIFSVLLTIILLFVGFCFAFSRSRQNNQIRAMLRTVDPAVAERSVELLRPQRLEDNLSRLLRDLGLAAPLDSLLDQAGSPWSSTKLVILAATSALISFFIGFQLPSFEFKWPLVLLLAVSGAALPLLLVKRKRAKRLRRFEEQFPEALDFLSRSLRAGHAFSVALEMLVADSPEPLAAVFRRVLGELHLGASLESSFAKMLELMPLLDVRFFISSVLLQQETGGNLSEILNKLSAVIRDRFRVKGQVKAAAAHGKITGLILTVMPLVVASLMFFAAPSYLMVLFTDPHGRLLVAGSLVAQVLGFLSIKKITDIKV